MFPFLRQRLLSLADAGQQLLCSLLLNGALTGEDFPEVLLSELLEYQDSVRFFSQVGRGLLEYRQCLIHLRLIHLSPIARLVVHAILLLHGRVELKLPCFDFVLLPRLSALEPLFHRLLQLCHRRKPLFPSALVEVPKFYHRRLLSNNCLHDGSTLQPFPNKDFYPLLLSLHCFELVLRPDSSSLFAWLFCQSGVLLLVEQGLLEASFDLSAISLVVLQGR